MHLWLYVGFFWGFSTGIYRVVIKIARLGDGSAARGIYYIEFATPHVISSLYMVTNYLSLIG